MTGIGTLRRHSGRTLSLAFILIILVSMGLSGWFALHEGSTRFLLPFTSDDATAQVSQAIADARGAETLGAAEMARLRAFSSETWAMAAVTDARRFVDSRIMEQGLYYTTMPRANQALMAAHVLTGAFCMLFGGLQFWPAFRRRWMKAHRIIGLTYVVTVPVSVVLAMAYLVLTPPHHIYAHLIAWIALWIFGALALISIVKALLALKARRIFEHQAWMALSFGCLMVAPLLRLNWVLLAWLLPHIDQETLNLVTMGLMLPQVLLITYGLILVNRQFERPMRQRKPAPIAAPAADLFQRAAPALLLLSAVVLGANAWLYLAREGVAGLMSATTLLPEALRLREQAVLTAQPALTLVFVLALGMAFPLAILTLQRLLRTSDEGDAGIAGLAPATALLALAGGLASAWLGWQIGLAPDKGLLAGGTMYLVNGAVIAGFGLMLLAMQRAGQRALMKESLVFLLCLLPFPAVFLATLEIMSLLPVPADYLAAGQGHVIPVGFSGGLLFLAILHVVQGQATREHN